MTYSVQMDTRQVNASLSAFVKNLPKELGIISWKTARKGESQVAKEVTQEIAVTQKVVKRHVSRGKTSKKTAAELMLAKSGRIPIRDFGARQTKKGVTYKIDKRKSRVLMPGAFQGPRPGLMFRKYKGLVFKRKGTERKPISHKRGPSPWGVMITKKHKRQNVTTYLEQELVRQSIERLRYRRLKATGGI